MLRDLVPLIQKVTEGRDLSADEAEQVFFTLESEDADSFFFFALLAALHTKGETSEELLGFCRANERFVPRFDVGVNPDKMVDLSGTGGDRIKTMNVSTAATFIVAAQGISVAKQSFLGVTGLTGSANVMQAFGVDPLGMSREGPSRVQEFVRRTGMVVYHANSMANPEGRRGYFKFWLENVPRTGLTFVTAYHLAANAYSPIPMRRRVYGVFGEKYLPPLAELFPKLGFTRGMVFHGVGGLDEISNIGPTRIMEFSDGALKDYTVTPADLGVRTAAESEIRATSREGNIVDFVRVLYGKDKGPKRDLVLVNASAVLYVMDAAPTLRDGVKLAASLVDDGRAAARLERYVETCGDVEKLDLLKADALKG